MEVADVKSSGMVWYGVVWSSVHGVVGYGFGMMWCGVVRCDVVWYGVV